MKVFREEAIEYAADRLHGEVLIGIPRAWQLVGYLMLALLAVTGCLLLLGSYSKVETVSGSLVPGLGVVQVTAPRTGVVASLEVQNGSNVSAGQLLLSVHSDEPLLEGSTLRAERLKALQIKDSGLSIQERATLAAAGRESQRLASDAGAARREATLLTAQLELQRHKIKLAQDFLAQARAVYGGGFVTGRELKLREEAVIDEQQQLSELEQRRSSACAREAAAKIGALHAEAQAEAAIGEIISTRADTREAIASAKAGGGFRIISPVAGRVAAVTAKVGQPVVANQVLLSLAPANARLRAELYVPSRAIGFLEVGQPVRLAIDAFSYERFGTVQARIVDLSTAPVSRRDSSSPEPVYLVTAELDEQAIQAFGKAQPLLPGMRLSARIVTRRQNLVEWLFDPIIAVARR